MLEILATIFVASQAGKIDPYLVAAVVQVESKFNSSTVGGLGEIGLMQLRPEYFANGKPEDLFVPEKNIAAGIKFLKTVEKRCQHKKDHTFLVCYNAGITGGSRIKNPSEFAYYKLVRKQYLRMKDSKIFHDLEKRQLESELAQSLSLASVSKLSFIPYFPQSSKLSNERSIILASNLGLMISVTNRRKWITTRFSMFFSGLFGLA